MNGIENNYVKWYCRYRGKIELQENLLLSCALKPDGIIWYKIHRT